MIKQLFIHDSRKITTDIERMLYLQSCSTQAKVAFEDAGINNASIEAIIAAGINLSSLKNNFSFSVFTGEYQVAAYAHLEKQIGKNEYFLHSIFVANNIRGNGIGSNLLLHITSELPNIHAFSFKENIGFFEKHGFRIEKLLPADFCPIDAQQAHPDGIYHIKKGVVSKKSMDKMVKKHRVYANEFAKNT